MAAHRRFLLFVPEFICLFSLTQCYRMRTSLRDNVHFSYISNSQNRKLTACRTERSVSGYRNRCTGKFLFFHPLQFMSDLRITASILFSRFHPWLSSERGLISILTHRNMSTNTLLTTTPKYSDISILKRKKPAVVIPCAPVALTLDL